MELLAPAGDYSSVLAAVNNGADAIYLGGQRFHARQKRVSFTKDELLKSFDYAHQRQKKVYVALNILLDPSEVYEALEDAYDLYEMGADGLIVQDIGLMQLVSQTLPQMRLHASTQTTIHQAEGLRLMQDFGVKRTVLARELSLEEIIQLHRKVPEMELEVFVHGALCYSYSGQCLFSSLVGGRSGNRGNCAQPCRKPYRIVCQNNSLETKLWSSAHYLLSTADQCLLESLPLLEKAGVTSLKIEGRLKKPEYVAMATQCYRQVLDRLPEVCSSQELHRMESHLRSLFNRDFTQDYLMGRKNVLRIDRPNNRGILIGQVEGQKKGKIFIRLRERVQQNDGLTLNGIQGKEISFTLRQLEVEGKRVNQAFPGECLAIFLRENVSVGEKVYRTRDAQQIQQIQNSLHEQKIPDSARIPLHMKLTAYVGHPLKLFAEDGKGRKVEVASDVLVDLAEKHPMRMEDIREKLSRLGNTPFFLQDLQMDISPQAMFPFRALNRLRREAVEKLERQSLSPKLQKMDFIERRNALSKNLSLVPKNSTFYQKPFLTVHVGNLSAAKTALSLGADRVIVDMMPFVPMAYAPEQLEDLVRTAENTGTGIVLALPRIHRGEKSTKILDQWVKSYPHMEFLLGNWGDIVWARDRELCFSTDYGLNIYNKVSYQTAIQYGARSVCLSVELNAEQLKAFGDLSRAELIVYGELILMVSEGCILSHVLPMRSNKNCPHYCAKDRYYLFDEKAYSFPLAHDAGCRQYVFNSRTLCLWEELATILKWRPYALRLEVQRYTSEQIAQILPIYHHYLENPYQEANRMMQGKEILQKNADSPCTRGHYWRGIHL